MLGKCECGGVVSKYKYYRLASTRYMSPFLRKHGQCLFLQCREAISEISARALERNPKYRRAVLCREIAAAEIVSKVSSE